jgi:hypothetical protein
MIFLAPSGTIRGVCGTASALTVTIFGMEYSSPTETYKVLAQTTVPSSVGTLYTASGVTAFIKTIVIANTTGSAVSGLILYVNGTAATNQLTGSLTIPANGMLIVTDHEITVYDGNGNVFHTAPSFATPALTLGTTAAPGVAATGIRSDATLNVFDSTIAAVTTPLALSATGSQAIFSRRDHKHQSPGGIAAITSEIQNSTTTALSIVTATIPANFLQVGTTFRIKLAGRYNAPSPASANTFIARIGTAGTTSDNTIVELDITSATTGSGIFFEQELLITVRTTGSGGTIEGLSYLFNVGGTGMSTTASNGPTLGNTSVNTTVQNILSVWFKSGSASGGVFYDVGTIEIVKM